MEESLERGWNDHEFSLGQVGFKVPVGHPSGDVEQASGCTSWEHRGVVWVKVQIIIRATAGEEKALRECVEEDAKERFQGTTVYNRVREGGGRLDSGEAVAGEAGETPGKEVSMEQMQ